MTTLELSLHHNYCPSWGVWEGIRELVQNALDAQDEGSPLEARYVEASGTVKIISRRARLSRETLLIGQTTKADREDLRGQFGEGLKIGLLALVRQGLRVTVRTGDEMWLPKIEQSRKYNAEVLKVKIRSTPQTSPDVIISVGGLAKTAWDELRELVLPLCPRSKRPKEVLKTSHGDILLDETYKGKIFAKGLYVAMSSKLRYGYDLADIKLDRDRKMADPDSLAWATTYAWNEAAALFPERFAAYADLANDPDARDLENITWAGSTPCQALAEAFKAQHGDSAVPVQTLAQSKELEHLNRRGVVVNPRIERVLAKVFGDYDKVKADASAAARRKLSWSDLTDLERRGLEATITMVARVQPAATLDTVDVVECEDESNLGRYVDGRIELAHKVLASPELTLAVYCHELSHGLGEDGSAKFHHGVEELLAAVAISNLLIGGAK